MTTEPGGAAGLARCGLRVSRLDSGHCGALVLMACLVGSKSVLRSLLSPANFICVLTDGEQIGNVKAGGRSTTSTSLAGGTCRTLCSCERPPALLQSDIDNRCCSTGPCRRRRQGHPVDSFQRIPPLPKSDVGRSSHIPIVNK